MSLLIASLLSRAGTGGTAGPGPVSMVPIGEWPLDETGGATFADSRPAAVPMTIVGTWQSLTTASMAVGSTGTSAYHGTGTVCAVLPAAVPAHDLAELTLSFYYQRNSATAKHTLIAAGDGTQAGDLLIEVLANGRLSGSHVGQDGVLRNFEGVAGVTGTNVGVNIAHRIDLTLGRLGAKLYLNGTFLSAAWIQDNTNGWNNLRAKYVGGMPTTFTDTYALYFEDTFNYTGPPNPAKWGAEGPAGGSTSDPAYATVDGSKLILRTTGTTYADRKSSGVRTSDSTYLNSWRGTIGLTNMFPSPGLLEVSMKPSEVRGVMSEIILWTDYQELPPGGTPPLARFGELDTVEAKGYQPGIYDFASHFWTQPNYSPTGQTDFGQSAFVDTKTTGKFHKFASYLSANRVEDYLDGVLRHRRNLTLTPDPYLIFGYPVALVIDCWIAGNGDTWTGAQGVAFPVDTHAEVDYVRYYSPTNANQPAVVNPADGGFDEIRLWGGQLSDAQIASLQPAQSIVLTVAPAPVAVSFNAGDLIQDTGVKLIDVLGVAGTVYTGIPTIAINSQSPSNLGATVDTSAWGAYAAGERPRLSIPTSASIVTLDGGAFTFIGNDITPLTSAGTLEVINGSATAVSMTVDSVPKQTMANWGFGMGVPSEWGGGQTNWQNTALPVYQAHATQLYTNLGTKLLRLNTFARDWAPVIVDAVNTRGVDRIHVTNYGWQASGASVAARATALVNGLEAALVNPGGIPLITSVSPQNEPGASEAFSDDVSDVVTAIRTELNNRGHSSVMVYPPEYANADSACLTGHQDIITAGATAINAVDAGASHSYNMAPGPDLYDDKLDQVGVKKTVWQFEMGNGDWNSVASRVLSDLNNGVASEVWHHGQAPNDGVAPNTLGGSQRLVNFDGTSNPYYTAFRLAAQAFPRGCIMRTVTNSFNWSSLSGGGTRPISTRAASRGWYTFGTKPAVCYSAGKRGDGTWRLAVMNATYNAATDPPPGNAGDFNNDFAGHFPAQTIQVTVTFSELTGVNGTWTGFRGVADGSTTAVSYPLVNGQLRLTLASQDMVVLGS